MVANFNEKEKLKRFSKKFLLQAAGILIIIIIAALIFVDVKIYFKRRDLINQVNFYKNQIEEIEKNNKALKQKIENSDDPDYLEKIAYEQLGQQKPGEKEVIFVVPEKEPEAPLASKKFWEIKSFTGWISSAWSWIKNKF